MLVPISGEMNFVPSPRKKSTSSSGPDEPLRFDECLIERLEAVDKDSASGEEQGGEEHGGDSGEQAGDAANETGAQGGGLDSETTMPGVRRIDLRA